MQILIAEHAGFCEGVERAYRIALEQTKTGKPVYMLGNLVHNSQVVEKLKNAGIKTVKSLSEIPTGIKGSLLISAHGVSPEVYNEAKKLKLEIIDTTCPWVKKAQHLAKELADKGMTVIIIGDEGHPEVKGLLGWAGTNSLVVQTPEDLAGIESLNFFQSGIGVVAQTTQSEANFDAIVKALRGKFKELVVHKTICGATSKRQNTAVELAQKVELMLVIGDKMSANTKRLAELCSQTGTETHQIQTADELDKNWIKGKAKIGITAGASTPEWVIKEVTTLLQAP
ncbi:MAG: 4-hydroxy-3-methylbut-2-enyl diphosphate reductase [bacterium]